MWKLSVPGWLRLLSAAALATASQPLFAGIAGACTNGSGWPR